MRIFGKIESVARDSDGSYFVHFDAAHFDERRIKFDSETVLRQILAKIPKQHFKEISKFSNYQDRWFQVAESKKGRFLGQSTTGVGFSSHGTAITQEPTNYRFELSAVDRKTALALNRALRTDGDILTEEEILRLHVATPLCELRVYNVGQGSATRAGCGPMPLFYFDLGGGIYQNRHTYPNIRRFRSISSTIVVLSHWDMDHFFSALDPQNADILKRTWIAPGPVPNRPTHARLAADILRRGRLLLWPPAGLGPIGTFGGCIGRASGRTANRNSSGLLMAVSLFCTDGIRRILLTGDADYRYIPQMFLEELDAVVVPHHGGIRRAGGTPAARRGAQDPACVFSFGRGNSYRHPNANICNEHQRQGWTTRYDTPNGDVVFYCRDGQWRRTVKGTDD